MRCAPTFVCAAHLWGMPDGLACQRNDPHASGHVFAASAGPEAGRD